MRNLVLVPGIFGTRMIRSDGFELWPPVGQAGQGMSDEGRAHDLLDTGTVPGALIEGVIPGPFLNLPEYSPMTGFLSRLPGSLLVRFPYDWRVDLRETAEVLASRLSLLQGPIVLIGHSMGGLICRYMLESGHFDTAPWFSRVEQFISIAVPHLGAPLAVLRLEGVEGVIPIAFGRFAMKLLGTRPQIYPAGHQLLPPSSSRCVRHLDGTMSNVADALPSIASSGLTAAAELHVTLDRFRRPPHVLYRFIYGHGHNDSHGNRDTVVEVAMTVGGGLARINGEGDGTVPMTSALPAGPVGFVDDLFGVVGEHVGMLADPAVQQRIQDWLLPNGSALMATVPTVGGNGAMFAGLAAFQPQDVTARATG